MLKSRLLYCLILQTDMQIAIPAVVRACLTSRLLYCLILLHANSYPGRSKGMLKSRLLYCLILLHANSYPGRSKGMLNIPFIILFNTTDTQIAIPAVVRACLNPVYYIV